MRETHKALRHTLLLLLLLTAGATGRAQQTTPPSEDDSTPAPSYIFVSPNTRTGLTLAEALRNLNSAEEVALILSARDVTCRLGVRARVVKTVGNWTDGSEHSALVRVTDDEPSVRYAEAWLGRRFRQKGVLHFVRRPAGASRMYVLRPRRARSLARIARALDRSGVANRTIVPGRRGAWVYVVDLENSLQREVAAAARRLRARRTVMRGAGAFVGDDADAEKARVVFDGVVREYEGEHPEVLKGCTNRRAGVRLGEGFLTWQTPRRVRRLRAWRLSVR